MRGLNLSLFWVCAGLQGCIWLTADDLAARMDPDGDGVQGDEDCAPDDASVGAAATLYLDRDGDGYGDPLQSQADCAPQEDLWVAVAGDCDDVNAEVHPEAVERCDDTDDDCDGETLPCTGELADADTILTGRIGSGAGKSFYAGADLTGDGQADLVVGAWQDDANGVEAGAAYLVPGPLQAGTSSLESAAVTTLLGEVELASADFGVRVHAGGDFDGDGAADLLIGGHKFELTRSAQGAAWLAYGPLAPGESILDGEQVPSWYGERSQDRAGWALLLVDLDADARAEAVIGAYGYALEEEGQPDVDDVGRVYFIPGSSEDLTGRHPLGDDDLSLQGDAEGLGLGVQMEQVSDLDGDGQAEIALLCPDSDEAGAAAGAVYLVFGLPASSGVVGDEASRLLGRAAGYGAGMSVSAGDADGDGDQDLWVGESKADDNGVDAGAVVLMAGPFSDGEGARSLNDGSARIDGVSAGDEVGADVAGDGDVDGDGQVDLLVGAIKDNAAAGEVGSVWLTRGPFAGAAEYGAGGATWWGVSDHAAAGRPLAISRALREDGAPLLLIGASNEALAGDGAGAVFGVVP